MGLESESCGLVACPLPGRLESAVDSSVEGGGAEPGALGPTISLKFGFKKSLNARKVGPSPASAGALEEGEPGTKDFVDSISGTRINGRLQPEEERKRDLVIPLIEQNLWRTGASKSSNGHVPETQPTTTTKANGSALHGLEDQAVAEILDSAKESAGKSKSEARAIPILLKNRIPGGFETDDNLDVSLRAEESSLEDYERIPISEFGLAMLRGMGWTKDSGIGHKNRRVVEMTEPQVRPKGLGLGARVPGSEKDAVPQTFCKKDRKDREVLSLKIGGFVLVTKGAHKNNYGKIESFDEDNNRVIVKLSNSSNIATVSKFYISLVSEPEYAKHARDSKRSKR